MGWRLYNFHVFHCYNRNCGVTLVYRESVLEISNIDKGEEFLLAVGGELRGDINTQKFILEVM